MKKIDYQLSRYEIEKLMELLYLVKDLNDIDEKLRVGFNTLVLSCCTNGKISIQESKELYQKLLIILTYKKENIEKRDVPIQEDDWKEWKPVTSDDNYIKYLNIRNHFEQMNRTDYWMRKVDMEYYKKLFSRIEKEEKTNGYKLWR